MRPWQRQKRRDSEHGAVAAIVAVLLGGGVLLGTGALVIDIGQLHLEREELQSAADAASARVAVACVRGGMDNCTNTKQATTASDYAARNVKDQQVDTVICINNSSCPAWNTDYTCPPLPTPPAGTGVGSYVEVRTSTRTSTGATVLPPTFAKMLAGSTYTGTTVGACARMNWGPLADTDIGRVFAMGISLCDWKRMTNNGATYYSALGTLLGQAGVLNLIGLPAPGVNAVSAIPMVTSVSLAGIPLPSCTTPVDLTVPRGWVWLNSTDGTSPDSNCTIDVNTGDWPRSFVLSGLYPGLYCNTVLQQLRSQNRPILVPIYDTIKRVLITVAPQYHIVGFAPFVVTGYDGLLGGVIGGLGNILNGGVLSGAAQALCAAAGNCVYGYFTQTMVSKSRPTFGTGDNYGASVIGRTG